MRAQCRYGRPIVDVPEGFAAPAAQRRPQTRPQWAYLPPLRWALASKARKTNDYGC